MNYEDINATLDKHFQSIDKIILSRQDAVTGLLPASTAVNAHGDYTDAWVRDNVYSVMSVWGLALSYEKHIPNHYRTYLLSQSVVKLMRGLLSAMMRQADRIEAYKTTHNPTDALHAKYGTSTGLAVVGDDEWGHLQLDATSLFVLMTAQMTASGLKLIYTIDEVNFVQNLVHYISRTYCTPDFGIWERGNKTNHGKTEINCSSVGMAKAALEAISGFNLFGNVVGNEAVIHVVPNDIARSRFTLYGLLPRESKSKETDAALLSIIGYPAYAIEDEQLIKKTRDKIIKKLSGRYGCKRFLLDGHQSSIEDSSRLYYEPSELRAFEHIESEWPLFFTYLLLDALMREDVEEIKLWKEKLEPLFVEQDGERLLPELFIVPSAVIEAEKANPNSQDRVPNENLPLVWAQSLYMLSDMIMQGVLDTNDIDPLRRRKRVGYKRSSNPMVSILAENDSVKQQLLDLGVGSETLEEVKPTRVMHASELSKIHTLLGKNKKLALTGRPLLMIRTITTASLYVIKGEKTIFLPYYFNPQSFYFAYDNKLLVEHFKASLTFLSKNWNQPGQVIVPFLVREDMLYDNTKEFVLELLYSLQNEKFDSLVIKTAPLEQILKSANVERINNLDSTELEALELQVISSRSYKTAEQREASQSLSSDESQNLEREYEEASSCHDWANARRIADLTGKIDDRLEDTLLDLIIFQKRLAVGRAYSEKAIFSQPMTNDVIVEVIKKFCGNSDAESILTQEIILHLGHLIRAEPELFANMITLRTWYFVQLLVGQISRKSNLSIGDSYNQLLTLAPHDIYDYLRATLKSFSKEATELTELENIYASDESSIDSIKVSPLDSELSKIDDWAFWREKMGMINGLSTDFYKNVWHLLQQCLGLVIGDKYNANSRIGSEITLESTAGELSFALKIDTLLQSIDASDYRQLNIEAIESLARVFRESPELYVNNDLTLDIIIGHAVKIAWTKEQGSENYNEQRGLAWEVFYTLTPKETDKAFIESFLHLLKTHED